jgi:hypothetical protein
MVRFPLIHAKLHPQQSGPKMKKALILVAGKRPIIEDQRLLKPVTLQSRFLFCCVDVL